MNELGVGLDGIGMFMYIRRGDISWETNVMVFDYSIPFSLSFYLSFSLSRDLKRLSEGK